MEYNTRRIIDSETQVMPTQPRTSRRAHVRSTAAQERGAGMPTELRPGAGARRAGAQLAAPVHGRRAVGGADSWVFGGCAPTLLRLASGVGG
jgi:hypothetical protein